METSSDDTLVACSTIRTKLPNPENKFQTILKDVCSDILHSDT